MYSWPPLNIFGRKQALGKNLSINEVNQKVATISRVILHPKYRSICLGVKLVKETLPLVRRSYVEVMAVMARYNPFFEKAGMQKIVERKPDRPISSAVEELEKLGFKRYLLSSARTNLEYLKRLDKSKLQRIREVLCTVRHYKRLRSTSKAYVKKAEFRKWMYEASLETIAKVISRLAVLAEKKVYLFWRKPYA